jgi:2-keto-4-pentenoate hydratase/2-oxohepta-3-ene-1,7-dioic acid hydratase in catechol pathway
VKTVQIKGRGEQISVGKIICIGRNYAEHAREMKSEVPSVPVFFLKPSTAIVRSGGEIVLPAISNDVHHEVELTVLIGKDGSTIPQSTAAGHIAGYGIGLDMTLRDVQEDAKKKGLPWTLAKGFDTSAPVSDFVPAHDVVNAGSFVVHLAVNGSVRQHAGTGDMIFPVDKLIAYVSQFVTLERGDVIFTGTPHGVARVQSGDHLEASLADPAGTVLASLSVHVR